MKLFTVVLALAILSLKGFSQENQTKDSLRILIKVPTQSLKKGNLPEEIVIPIVKFETSETVDIKAEYWSTTAFNPYQNALVKFPLKIEFKDSLYTSPISKNKVITSRFGWRNRRPHKGIDIDLVTGDNVRAMAGGIVRFSRYSTGHGKTVIVRHYNGLETVYAHLSEYSVKANDSITKGQVLGKGGNTGNSRGSHLHLVTMFKGIAINPDYLFDFGSSNKIRNNELWITRQWTTPHLHSSKRLSKLNVLASESEALTSIAKLPKVYVVKRGDTLYRISVNNSIPLSTLCKTNYIKASSVLKVGQKIILQP